MSHADGQGSVAIVGGCGHVGLPLGLAFASRGLQVVLYDLNERAVALVNEGDDAVRRARRARGPGLGRGVGTPPGVELRPT